MGYFIKGNRDRGFEVIKALEAKGGENVNHYNGNDEDSFYYFIKGELESFIYRIDINPTSKSMLQKVCISITLPPEKYIPTRGDRVLVRNGNNSIWIEADFSFMSLDGLYYTVGGALWTQCVPFNSHVLGTTLDLDEI